MLTIQSLGTYDARVLGESDGCSQRIYDNERTECDWWEDERGEVVKSPVDRRPGTPARNFKRRPPTQRSRSDGPPFTSDLIAKPSY